MSSRSLLSKQLALQLFSANSRFPRQCLFWAQQLYQISSKIQGSKGFNSFPGWRMWNGFDGKKFLSPVGSHEELPSESGNFGADLFQGTAVYAFLTCPEASHCEFDIDNIGAHDNLMPANIKNTSGCGPNDNGDDAVNPLSSPAKSKPPIAEIVGGLIGELGLLAVLAAMVVYFKRRSGRRKTASGRIYLGDTDPAPDVKPGTAVVRAGSPQHAQHTAVLAEQIRVLQAQTTELQRAQRAPSAGTRLATMKRKQVRVVREHAPAQPAADLVLHTDSGLRLAPARRVEELPPEYAPD
ncbi:hypothetical protein FB451DRAFT_1171945 [Mycena latifolia]|nr:hypothetical protein FB451DRAFT_1171945 [Mycena latifolia]